MSPATLALAWCYSRWFAASTIVGATTLAQLEENLDAWNAQLHEDLVAAIGVIHKEITNPAQ